MKGQDAFAGVPDGPPWRLHDMQRPEPHPIHPGDVRMGQPPSDAEVLFDGSNLDRWRSSGGGPAGWKVEDGYMEVEGEEDIVTRGSFGDCQLHVEWAAPAMVSGDSQARGNSGVFFMGGRYEIQVLDSYQNSTYADGHAGAIYGQYPPRVIASRPPGEWQSYDIIFHGPRFEEDGSLERPARITVFHNNVLVQDNVTLTGPTAWLTRPEYEPHPEKLPIELQNHGDPVRFRNIWIRELSAPDPLDSPHERPEITPEITLTAEQLERFTGAYGDPNDPFAVVSEKDDALFIKVGNQDPVRLVPQSETVFVPDLLDARITFHVDAQGQVRQVTFDSGGSSRTRDKVE